jgi:hypothetical protein
MALPVAGSTVKICGSRESHGTPGRTAGLVIGGSSWWYALSRAPPYSQYMMCPLPPLGSLCGRWVHVIVRPSGPVVVACQSMHWSPGLGLVCANGARVMAAAAARPGMSSFFTVILSLRTEVLSCTVNNEVRFGAAHGDAPLVPVLRRERRR